MTKSTFISIFGLVRIISYLDIGRRLIFYWHLTFNKRLNHYSRSSWCERIIGNFSRTLYIWKTMRINIEITFVCFFTLDFLYHIYTCVLFEIQILFSVVMHFFWIVFSSHIDWDEILVGTSMSSWTNWSLELESFKLE